MANEKLFHVGVKGLIKNGESNILLLQAPGWEKNGTAAHWDIPGGRIQKGSNELETLKREIEEETGIIDLTNIAFFHAVISNHQIPLSDDLIVGLVLMVYTVTIPDDAEIALSKEHIAFEWVKPFDAAKRLSNKYPESFVRRVAQ